MQGRLGLLECRLCIPMTLQISSTCWGERGHPSWGCCARTTSYSLFKLLSPSFGPGVALANALAAAGATVCGMLQ